MLPRDILPRAVMRFPLLFLVGFIATATSQSDDDSALHFSNGQNGRAVWIVEESSLPWIGSYEYLSSLQADSTVLMTVVDSSTGKTLGECTSESHGSKWVRFQWALASDSMQCTVSPTNSSRVVFPATTDPRTFSVRIQAARGPACLRDMMVQNERPVGCPPHLARNSFSSLQLACSCPYETASVEDTSDSGEPQFPIFELGTPSSPTQETPAWTVSPCANYQCLHNGTCVVTQEGQATCLCQNGFIGAKCEVDVCSTVPCQNGGHCRANGGEATCECPAGFTGILCESAACNPECSNGECHVAVNGTASCECTQGFIGINCNVIDVCLGDAACAMFGDNAKCVPEASNYGMFSRTLVNATYDCRCPHPVNGEFVDCLQLHLASVQPSSLSTAAPPPTFPAVDMVAGQPGILPSSSTKRVLVEQATTPLPALPPVVDSQQPSPRPTFSIHPSHPQFPQTSFVPQVSDVTTQKPGFSWPTVPSILPLQTIQPVQPSTFVFPQTPQTTTQRPTVPVHSATHSIVPSVEEMEEEEEETEPVSTPSSRMPVVSVEQAFPTPSPMPMGQPTQQVTTTHGRGDFNPFHALVTTESPTKPLPSVVPSSVPTVDQTEEVLETTTEMIEESTTPEYEEEETETLAPSTEMETDAPFTEMETTTGSRTPPVWPALQGATEQPPTIHVEPSTQSTLPFWMFSTQTPPRVIPHVTNPHVVDPQHPDEEELTPTDEFTSQEHETSAEHTEQTPPVETSTTDVHQQESGTDRSTKSATASWIVALVAFLVLGLLLLGAALFICRYIKQSRKLHGKYNPAREERDLSAAYSMPMSHITKEERLI